MKTLKTRINLDGDTEVTVLKRELDLITSQRDELLHYLEVAVNWIDYRLESEPDLAEWDDEDQGTYERLNTAIARARGK